MGRFCDQFLNALDGLYKGRIIAQTARESAIGDTPLAATTLRRRARGQSSVVVVVGSPRPRRHSCRLSSALCRVGA